MHSIKKKGCCTPNEELPGTSIRRVIQPILTPTGRQEHDDRIDEHKAKHGESDPAPLLGQLESKNQQDRPYKIEMFFDAE
ncbi:hypothetical protein AA310_06980 [Arthrobacter sp. YC-RL1]|nr:hypothetical protein ATC04_10920 [Arthrobacter sp. YC-RL1]KLI87705.1 hypothetical protein AA310_06980 [Arthrobacter sp. YC-RL1]